MSGAEGWECELCIVGAGAAGLWAAAVAAARGTDVLVLEKTPRTGTKVLASGGTHCNLTTTLGPDAAARLFGAQGERFLRPAFRRLPPAAVRERFHAFGVPTIEAPLEKVFPASGRARDVRDALEREARAAGARIALNAPVVGVAPAFRAGAGPAPGARGWEVRVADGRSARARRVFLCSGGKSYPRTGTTGEGYAWLAELGLEVREPVPALVPLASPAAWVRDLTGIAWAGGEARLLDASGRVLGRRRRPLLFTHFGVSGPAAMDLSAHVARAPGANVLQLDLFPDVSREELRAHLVDAAGARGAPRVGEVLPERVPERLLAAACAAAGVQERRPRVVDLSKATRHALIEALKGLAIPVAGTLGFDKAEVTAGGLALRQVDPLSMEVTGLSGLHVFGELLDLDGPIGGLNFQAAFACAEVAACALG